MKGVNIVQLGGVDAWELKELAEVETIAHPVPVGGILHFIRNKVYICQMNA